VHGNAADIMSIEDIAARLQAGGDALRGHIMAQVLEAMRLEMELVYAAR
jgi:hypothetical protein